MESPSGHVRRRSRGGPNLRPSNGLILGERWRSMVPWLLGCWWLGICQVGYGQPAEDDRADAFRQVVLIQFGTREQPAEIGPLSEAAFLRKLAKAESLGADLVLIEIDSPGGTIDSSMKLAETLRDVSWAKTWAWIPREALSGAAIMSLGCDEILIGEQAHIGDAGPIFMGEDFLFRHAPEKIRSDLASKVRTLAKQGGRSPAIAEAMVDMAVEVYKVTNVSSGAVSYMSDAELRALEDPTEWQRGPLLEPSKKDRFLELDGRQAVDVGLADAMVGSRTALAERIGIPLDDILVMEPSWADTLVTLLNLWPITILLFVIGLIALYLELAAPGIGIGGLVSGLCFSLFFWSRFLGGTAGWLELLLFAAGVIFLLVELFVIPGFGLAGLGGLLLLLTSLVMAGQRWGTADGLSANELINSVFYLAAAGLASIGGMIVVSRYFGGIQLFKKLTLDAPVPITTASSLAAGRESHPSEGRVAAVGDVGIADSTLRPAGRVLFGEEYRDVITDGSFISKGSRVRVIKISGTHITVREIP